MKKIIWLNMFLAFSVMASQNKSGDALSTQVRENQILALLKEGFHFNEKAPNRVTTETTTVRASRLSPREAAFDLPPGWSVATGLFYICDDANTYCEPRSVALNSGFVGTPAENVAKTSGAQVDTRALRIHKSRGKVNSHGFIEDDLSQALELAKRNNKLVLIDFSARWCPGCVRLEKETFNTPRFKAATKNLIKVKLDSDRFENIITGEKYNVKAIPTLLVVNSDQLEINRLVDYQPLARIEDFFADIKKDSTPLPILMDESKKTENVSELKLITLGQRLTVANQFSEALKVFEKVKNKPFEFLLAKVEAAAQDYKADKSNKSYYLKTLREAIAAEPQSFRSIGWRTKLAGEVDDKTEMEKLATEGARLASELLSDSQKLKSTVNGDQVGEFVGYESLYVAMARAELIETAGLDSKDAWKQAADVGKSLKISPRKSGPALRYLIVLTVAGQLEEADKLAKALLKLNPSDGDVQRRHLRVLVELKRYKEAVGLGEKAIKNAYERNEFWVAENLAKAYIGANKKVEAKTLLDQYLARADADWENMKGTKTKLLDMRKTL